MRWPWRKICAFALFFFFSAVAELAAQPHLKTRNVVLIVADGLRWQEVFQGADPSLMDKEHGGVENVDRLRHDFWRDSPSARRETLLPFMWKVVAQQGQIFGNQEKGSVARVTNGLAFSYPGYNEMLTGFPDPRIDKNEFGPNPNLTVFEWLNNFPEYHNQVAAFATWSTFIDIFNQKRSGIYVSAGWDPPFGEGRLTPEKALLKDLYRTTTRLWDDDVYDAFVQPLLLDYLKSRRPRVVFVGYGETDDWAHAGRYDLLLQAAQQIDQFVEQLWTTMQSMPDYRNQTTFIITADHGRGSGLTEWKEHGAEQAGSENIWIAVLGPDTAPLGERAHLPPVTQSQIAATLAALLARNYNKAVPKAALPLPDVIGRTQISLARFHRGVH